MNTIMTPVPCFGVPVAVLNVCRRVGLYNKINFYQFLEQESTVY